MRKSLPKSMPLALAIAASLSGSMGTLRAQTGPADALPRVVHAADPVFDIHGLDTAVNPCDDFYRFVNDKWVASHPIPADQSSWNVFAELAEKSRAIQRDIVESADKHADTAKAGSIEQKIGWYYRSGMDKAAIERAGFDPVKPVLADITALKNNAQLADFISQRFAQGDQQVFSFGSNPDFKDTTKMIGFVAQSGVSLPTEYYQGKDHAADRAALHAYIARTFSLIGLSATQARQQADQVMAFETTLAGASLTPTALRDLSNEYHIVSVSEADKLTPHFPWERFFKAQGVTIGKGFSLAQPKFFGEFDKLLAHAPLAQWQASLRFHAVADHDSALSKAFVDSSFEFEKATSGQAEQKAPWKRMLGSINSRMAFALGELYAAREFTPDAKQRALALINHLLVAYRQRIEKLGWMTPETKRKALAKLSLMVPRIGYPDHWRDWSGLDIQPEGYFANVQRVDQFNYRYDVAKIGKATDRAEWPDSMAPQVVNAGYGMLGNDITFPAAILQPPFFYADSDDALNYGAIGAVIGHEISHGFDDQGSRFDGHGNQADWWSKQDRTQFDQRTAKLVDQFDQYRSLAAKPQLHVNGKLTLGENIADLGGLNVAYDALHLALADQPEAKSLPIDGYKPDQRFFMAWARAWRIHIADKTAENYLTIDPHAPSALRAIAAPSNMPAFATAFQCKPGAPMVRPQDKQVKIW